MNKIKRSLAILLIIGLVITGMPINMANAAENNVVNGENTNITVVDDNQSDSNTATDDEQDETIKEEDAKTTDEGTNVSESQDDSADIQLNYIYVESPKVTTPGEQNIVVSLGGNFDDIENVKLNYQKDNGKTKSWKSSDSAEGAFLFTKDFKDTDTGVYDIVSVSFEVNGATKEIVLKEMGHEAHFGVNEEYKVDSNEVLEVQSDGSLVEKSEIDNSTLENENTVVEVDPSDMEQVSNDVKSAITNQIGSKALSSRAGDDKLIIYLDPGHDNTHTGSGHGSLREEKLNLQIAQYCRAELEQYSGVEVRMTRSDSGACPYPGTNKDQCLLNRIDDACDNGADAYVSIHLNASGVGANGAEVWYWYNNATGNGLANKIQDQLVALGLNDRGAKPDSPYVGEGTYAVTRECEERGVAGIIVEHAFMDGSTDYSFLSNSNNIKKLGLADAKGIVNYFGLSKGEWVETSAGKKYQYSDGTYAKGYIAIEGKYYYFDSNGYLCGGYQKINGQPYQFYMEEGYGYGKGWINYTTGEKAYCLGGGELATGYAKIDNTYYYFGTDGFMRGGYQKINGKPYQFYTEEGYGYGKGWINYTTGEKAYCLGGGELATGYTKIDNKYYYFGTDGFMCGGYQKINGKPYQFYTEEGYGYGKGWINYTTGEKAYCLGDGELATGYIEIGNKYYYFGADGYMLVGHQIINGKPYQFYTAEGYGYGEGWINYTTGEKEYCLGGGELVTGTTEINGVIYSFNSDGYLVSQSKHSITGKTNTTVEELVAYYEKHSPIQYSEYYAKSKDKEATTLEEFCRIYIEEATIENINVEVAFCQAMKETGWLQFGGAVKPNQFNFAGIGAIDSAPQNAASFENARQGIRAQIQHLKAYANTENLINTCVDPRFNLVTRGSAPYVEDLGGKWASDKNYGFSIVEMMQDI